MGRNGDIILINLMFLFKIACSQLNARGTKKSLVHYKCNAKVHKTKRQTHLFKLSDNVGTRTLKIVLLWVQRTNPQQEQNSKESKTKFSRTWRLNIFSVI